MRFAVVAASAAMILAGCGTSAGDMPSMDKDGTYYHIIDTGGTYETAGSARTSGRPCSWMRLGAGWDKKNGISDLAAGLIDRGDVQSGEAARVTVQSGEYFVSFGCAPWRFVG